MKQLDVLSKLIKRVHATKRLLYQKKVKLYMILKKLKRITVVWFYTV